MPPRRTRPCLDLARMALPLGMALALCGMAHAASPDRSGRAAALKEVGVEGDWHLFCPGGIQGHDLAGCVVVMRAKSEDDPARWVRMGFFFPSPGKDPTIEILVPSTAMTHDGISLGVDGRQVGTVPMGPCGASGCQAHVVVDGRLLDELDGRDVQVEYQVDKDSGVRHDLPVAGLDAFIRRSGIRASSRRQGG